MGTPKNVPQHGTEILLITCIDKIYGNTTHGKQKMGERAGLWGIRSGNGRKWWNLWGIMQTLCKCGCVGHGGGGVQY